MRKLMDFSGLEEDRLRARWVSSAEASEFREEINDFVQTLKKLGPSPLRKRAAQDQAA